MPVYEPTFLATVVLVAVELVLVAILCMEDDVVDCLLFSFSG